MGYKFATKLYADGTTEGINNVGTYDYGSWVIDFKNHRMGTTWKNGWIDTVTNAYEIGNQIYFFDADSGNWRTTFKTIESFKS